MELEEVRLKRIENIIGYELPKKFKEIYINNIYNINNVNLLPLDRIILAIDDAIYCEGEEDEYLEIEPTDTIIKKDYIKERVPFITDFSGNYIGIDYKPSAKGVVGQIINYGRDENKMTVLANSFEDFIEGLQQINYDGKIYITDYLLDNHIVFRNKINNDRIPAKIQLPNLERKEAKKEKINEYSNAIKFSEELLENIMKVMEQIHNKLEIDTNILKNKDLFDEYRIKNFKDSLSRTMQGKYQFLKKMEEYPKEEIKGYSIYKKISIEEQINNELKVGEESIFIDINIAGNVIVRYRETISNCYFKEAFEKICKILS